MTDAYGYGYGYGYDSVCTYRPGTWLTYLSVYLPFASSRKARTREGMTGTQETGETERERGTEQKEKH